MRVKLDEREKGEGEGAWMVLVIWNVLRVRPDLLFYGIEGISQRGGAGGY